MFIIEGSTPYFMLIQSLYEKSHYLGAFIICHQRGGPAEHTRGSWEGGGHRIRADTLPLISDPPGNN